MWASCLSGGPVQMWHSWPGVSFTCSDKIWQDPSPILSRLIDRHDHFSGSILVPGMPHLDRTPVARLARRLRRCMWLCQSSYIYLPCIYWFLTRLRQSATSTKEELYFNLDWLRTLPAVFSLLPIILNHDYPIHSCVSSISLEHYDWKSSRIYKNVSNPVSWPSRRLHFCFY